ncbi:MAG: SRPBCC domain-containing protein [Chloroflexota bacterium]
MTTNNETIDVTTLNLSHRKIYTDIIIDAPPAQVWEVLTDFSSYDQWAAFLVGIEGETKDQAQISATFQFNPNRNATNTVERTIFYEEGKKFGWAEKGPFGIVDNHQFIVEAAQDNKTRFIQSDELKQGATWLVGGYFSKAYANRYSQFNQSLKAAVENKLAS